MTLPRVLEELSPTDAPATPLHCVRSLACITGASCVCLCAACTGARGDVPPPASSLADRVAVLEARCHALGNVVQSLVLQVERRPR